jgi:hypothetical protein
MHTGRVDATATRLNSGKVLIAGGSNSFGGLSETIYASAEIYDPATGKFTSTGSMAAARADHTATLLADGRVLIAGGAGCSNPRLCSGVASSSGEILASAEIYDPASGKFSATGSMAAARAYGTATLLPDGRVLLAQGSQSQWAELYDPKSGKFVRTGKETGFDYTIATLLPNGKVLVTGRNGETTGAQLYDEASGKFTTISLALAADAAPPARYPGLYRTEPGAATLLKDGRILLFEGGYLETYDPATGACAAAGFISPAGEWLRATATLLADGRVLYEGGALQSAGSDTVAGTSSAVLYDPAGGPVATGTTLAARQFQTATLLPNGSVLIAGGEDNDGKPLASAELFKP